MRLDKIVARDIGKTFGRRRVFTGLNAVFQAGEIVAVTGINGSGKSTLLRILAGLLSPTTGRVDGYCGVAAIRGESVTRQTGFVAPYLNVYESFTPRENLHFIVRARGRATLSLRIDDVLAEVGLTEVADDAVSTLSSGMTQRVRLGAAVLHEPSVLMFDEPGTNLDAAGRAIVQEMISGYKAAGRLVIVATNDDTEAALCDREICLSNLSRSA